MDWEFAPGVQRKGARARLFMANRRAYFFFAAFFFEPLAAFFAIGNPPLHVVWMGECPAATTRRTLPPGTSARVPATLASWATPVNTRERSNSQAKKIGVLIEHPFKLAEELPLLRGLLLRALGSLLRHCFLLRISDSASDEPHGRHNGWAEPSTLIPDVDYG